MASDQCFLMTPGRRQDKGQGRCDRTYSLDTTVHIISHPLRPVMYLRQHSLYTQFTPLELSSEKTPSI